MDLQTSGISITLCHVDTRFSLRYKRCLDKIILDKKFLPLVTDCNYKAMVILDHSPVVVSIRIPNVCSNYRQWRFNPVKFIEAEIELFLSINQTPGMYGNL